MKKKMEKKKVENQEQDSQVIEGKAEKPIGGIKLFFSAAKRFLISKSAEEAKYRKKIENKLAKQVKPAVFFGIISISICLGFFVMWGGFAPLDSAVVAEGAIILSGNHKTIQHLEGGVIEEIFVKDGQEVKADEVLIKLNDTAAKSHVHVILSQLRFAKALEKRLVAEEQDAEEIDFDDGVLDLEDKEVQTLTKNQESLFKLKRKALKGAIEVYNQRVLQKQAEINASEARLKAIKSRLIISKESLDTTQKLYEKGLELKPRLLGYQEKYQELEGEMYSVTAQIARAKEEVYENELHKINAENDFKQKSAQEYKENHAHVLELEQKLQASREVLARTLIKAPKSGIVTGLQYHTVGGVLQQGAKVMDIVPQDDELIVEAYVMPQFIESLRVGLDAKVQLNAYKSRLVPRVAGEVIYVSADKFMNQNNGQSFYTIRIRLYENAIENINTDIKLYPGMPVTAFIVRGTRTFLEYMISPIVDSFHKSFKEA